MNLLIIKRQLKFICGLLIFSSILHADWPILRVTSNSPIHQAVPYIDGDKLIFTDFEGKTDQGYASDDLPNLKWFNLSDWTYGYIVQDDGGAYKDYDGVPNDEYSGNGYNGVGSRCVVDSDKTLYAHAKYYGAPLYKWVSKIAERNVEGGAETVWFSLTNSPLQTAFLPTFASTGVLFISEHLSDNPELFWKAAPNATPRKISNSTIYGNSAPWTYGRRAVWIRRDNSIASLEKWDIMKTEDFVNGNPTVLEYVGSASRQGGVSINHRGIAWNRELFAAGSLKNNLIRFLPENSGSIKTIYNEIADSDIDTGHLRWGKLWGDRWVGLRDAGLKSQDVIQVHLDSERIKVIGKIPSICYFKDLNPNLSVSDNGVIPVVGKSDLFLFLKAEVREAVNNGTVGSKNVTLDLAAPGAKFMKIANSTNNWSAVPWQNYTNELQWILEADFGSNRVWFQFFYTNANINRTSSIGWDDAFTFSAPEIDTNALIFPSYNASLFAPFSTNIIWDSYKISDEIDGSNLTISKISLLLADSSNEIAIIHTDVPNLLGEIPWLVSDSLINYNTNYILKFEVVDSSSLTNYCIFSNNSFAIIPEPAFFLIFFLLILNRLKCRVGAH